MVAKCGYFHGFGTISPRIRVLQVIENYTFFDSICQVGYVFPHLYALETRTLLWFGHGCTGNRMLSKHERYYGLGMDALVAVCSRNTNVIMVLAWMIW